MRAGRIALVDRQAFWRRVHKRGAHLGAHQGEPKELQPAWPTLGTAVDRADFLCAYPKFFRFGKEHRSLAGREAQVFSAQHGGLAIHQQRCEADVWRRSAADEHPDMRWQARQKRPEKAQDCIVRQRLELVQHDGDRCIHVPETVEDRVGEVARPATDLRPCMAVQSARRCQRSQQFTKVRVEAPGIVVCIVQRQPGGAPTHGLVGCLDLLQGGRFAVACRALQHRDTGAVVQQYAVEDRVPSHCAGINRGCEEFVASDFAGEAKTFDRFEKSHR